MTSRHKALTGLLAIALVLLLLAAGAVGVSAQAGWLDFWQPVRFRGNTDTYGTTLQRGAVTMSDNLTVTGIATMANMTSTGTVAETFLRLNPGTTQVLTFDSTLTPLASNQPISAAGNIGTSSIISKPAGTILRIVNVSNTTITFTDTGSLLLAGNVALGQNDTLMLLSDGTNWLQMGTSNN
ncbi:MAG: hypothetical protein U0X20_23765 [Caldilineaceae bacterium]